MKNIFAGVLFLFSCSIALAEPELSPDEKPLARQGYGHAILSLSGSGPYFHMASEVEVQYRKPGGASDSYTLGYRNFGLLNKAKDTEFVKNHEGKLFILELPAGEYEFYTYKIKTINNIHTPSFTFSKRFSVKEGEIDYIGNIDIHSQLDLKVLADPNVFSKDKDSPLTVVVVTSDDYDEDISILRRGYPWANSLEIKDTTILVGLDAELDNERKLLKNSIKNNDVPRQKAYLKKLWNRMDPELPVVSRSNRELGRMLLHLSDGDDTKTSLNFADFLSGAFSDPKFSSRSTDSSVPDFKWPDYDRALYYYKRVALTDTIEGLRATGRLWKIYADGQLQQARDLEEVKKWESRFAAIRSKVAGAETEIKRISKGCQIFKDRYNGFCE